MPADLTSLLVTGPFMVNRAEGVVRLARAWGVASVLAVCIAAAFSTIGCGRADESSLGVDEAALIDGREDIVRAGDFRAPYDWFNERNWARNATVMILPVVPTSGGTGRLEFSSGCSGVLVAPRIVLTAAHCVRTADVSFFLVSFGPLGFPSADGFPGSTALTSDGTPVPALAAGTAESAGTLAAFGGVASGVWCETHPANQLRASCGDGVPNPDMVTPTDSQFDIAMLFLNERVDRHPNDLGVGALANPASIVRSTPSGAVTHAGFGQVTTCPYVGIPTTVPMLRQVAVQNVLCTSSAPGSSTCFDDLMTLTPFGGQHGDSGGPVYLGGTIGATPLVAAGVFSSFYGTLCGSDAFDIAVSLAEPNVASWLEEFLGPDYGGTMFTPPGSGRSMWTGPDDVPRARDADRTSADQVADPDGDGLVGPHDNCWGIANYRQLSSDDAASTTCRQRRWTPSGSCEVRATEFTWEDVSYGCIPSDPAGVEIGYDPDGDGVPTACDNCDRPNMDQADFDGDGTGDACEIDSDGDGTDDDCDECPFITTPGVRMDCNIDAEMQFNDGATLRDECELNPCVDVEPTAVRLPPTPVLPGRGIFSGGLTGHALMGDPRFAAAFDHDYRVGMRWCPCATADGRDLASRLRCQRPDLGACTVNNGDEFGSPPAADADWRGMQYSVTTPAAPSGFDSVRDMLTVRHEFPGLRPPDLAAVWNFTSDPSTESFRLTTTSLGEIVQVRLRAEVWTHDAPLTCAGRRCPPPFTEELASHYSAENFEWLLTEPPTVPGLPPRGFSFPPWPAPEPICTVCAASFPTPYLALDPCFASGTCPDPAWSVRVGDSQIDGTRFLSPTASTLLATTRAFVVPSEPVGTLALDAVRLVALGPNLEPALALVAGGKQMLDLHEGLQQQRSVGPQEPHPIWGCGESSALVLFGNLHLLLRVGGEQFHTVTALDLDTGTSSDARFTGDLPVDIVAAAGGIDYSEILVVERRRGERHREELRIIRGDLRTDSFTHLATVRPARNYDSWWLVAQADGAYALVASSERRGVHAVARLELDRSGALGVRVTQIEAGTGALVGPPIGSMQGVTVAARDRRSWRTIGYRFREARSRAGRPDGHPRPSAPSCRIEDLF